MVKKKILLVAGCLLLVYSVVIITTTFFSKKYYAFESAEGFGAYTEGGRYGTTYHVTTTEDSNKEGTLRYAIEQPHPRLIIFDISGIIDLKSPLVIEDGSITIAGQTAPGDGICLRGNGIVIKANNVILRYLRIRPGKTTKSPVALTINDAQNIIVDHCSFSWAKGGNILIHNGQKITIQWSFINETLGNFGIFLDKNNKFISIHHNMFANNHLSNINFNPSYTNEYIDIRNNMFFNWDTDNITNPGKGKYNVVKNYYKFGANTNINNKNKLVTTQYSPKDIKMIFIDENNVFINPILSTNNVAGIYPNDEFLQKSKNSYVVPQQFYHSAITTHSGEKVKQYIMDLAGASLRRDYSDFKILRDIDVPTFKQDNLYVNFGIYPEYNTESIFVDFDNDGIRDDWEVKNDLNPFDPLDALERHKKFRTYTNRDVYLASFVSDVTKRQFKGIQFTIDTMKIKFHKFIAKMKK